MFKHDKVFFIELKGIDPVFQNIKYEGVGTLATAKKIIKRLSKITGYENGDIKSILLCSDCDKKLSRLLK